MNHFMEDNSTGHPAPRRFQFTLKTLFVISFAFAIYCVCIFSNYDGIRHLTLLLTLLAYPMVLLAFVIYGRGYLRTYCIGAAITFFPFSVSGIILLYLMLIAIQGGFGGESIDFTVSHSFEDGFEYLWQAVSVIAMVLLSAIPGSSMLVTRWLIDRSRRKERSAAMPIVKPVVPAPHVDCAVIDAENVAMR
jgi:hypothetical protein